MREEQIEEETIRRQNLLTELDNLLNKFKKDAIDIIEAMDFKKDHEDYAKTLTDDYCENIRSDILDSSINYYIDSEDEDMRQELPSEERPYCPAII